jgi:hypothetical protein
LARDGYTVNAMLDYATAGYDMTKALERARYVGVRNTRVVGGLLLHTTRRYSKPT